MSPLPTTETLWGGGIGEGAMRMLHQARIRRRSMLVLALGHMVLFILAAVGRLSYSVPPGPGNEILQSFADAQIWLVLHGLCALGLLVAYFRQTWELQMLCASATFMGYWSILNLIWGVSALQPVSLAGPSLGCVLTLAGILLIWSWHGNPGR